MTVILDKFDQPTAEPPGLPVMPGWTVVADLTPPELVSGRRIKVARRGIVAGLGLVAVLCAAGGYLAGQKSDTASDALNVSTARTTQLTAEQSRYAKVTQIETALSAAKSQQATLLGTDVDTAKLFDAIDKATPMDVGLTSININLVPAAAGVPVTDGTSSIGTVDLTGTAKHLYDVADLVENLNTTRGFITVLPATNTAASGGTATWTLSFQLTSAWYSKRYGTPADTTTAPTSTATTATSATPSGGN